MMNNMKTRVEEQFNIVDRQITRWMAQNGLSLMRVSLGIVFFWFGALKLLPGLSPAESLQLGFVDRETKGIHAGHLCYGILSQTDITLVDHKTGVMNLNIRARRQGYLDRKEPLPADLDALLKMKQVAVPWKADTEWHELVLVTEGDEMRLSIDGTLLARHRSEGFAHPMKRWFSFLVPATVWIDDVKIWRVN